ncbi:hypothetical protein DFP74_2715 [Nocardiopsis sp. Huas11]|uniref:hypothetical protein n=1 Tax=Nocardiopsis sp. Huas11 TaxID=2183912 RepID=UPI000F1B7B43|nr:hypothetical protein [Nocardiopsis sp. Huas11]RKS07060.1 hypothetical protein DFP74_2715 [Nocardiopsis sp. Huas11]
MPENNDPANNENEKEGNPITPRGGRIVRTAGITAVIFGTMYTTAHTIAIVIEALGSCGLGG